MELALRDWHYHGDYGLGDGCVGKLCMLYIYPKVYVLTLIDLIFTAFLEKKRLRKMRLGVAIPGTVTPPYHLGSLTPWTTRGLTVEGVIILINRSTCIPLTTSCQLHVHKSCMYTVIHNTYNKQILYAAQPLWAE